MVASDVNFNVSHNREHGLIGFATKARAALGVDMAVCAAGRDFDGIGDRVYSPRERRVLSRVARGAKSALFYRLWKLKEARSSRRCTRASSLDPSRFEVPSPMLKGERSAICRFPTTRSTPSGWRIWESPGSQPRARGNCRYGTWAGPDSPSISGRAARGSEPTSAQTGNTESASRVIFGQGGPGIGPRRVRPTRSVPSGGASDSRAHSALLLVLLKDLQCAAPLGGELGQCEVGAGCGSFSSATQKRPGGAASRMARAT